MAILNPGEINVQAFEPKVQNRFLLLMEGIESFMVRAISTPEFTDEVITLHHINSYQKIRGKRDWADMTMTLYDPISPSGAQQVMDWARLSYESVTGRAGYQDFYKKQLTLQHLGPVGDIVGEWVIVGAFINNANFGDLDWSSSDQVDITLSISMDYCILNY